MKNIAIITARSGSKGLKDKNIKVLCGKPLIAYSIQTAIESNCFDTIMVSTDSEKYREIAISYGADVPFLRDDNLSNDNASSWDVVLNVLNNYKKENKYFDSVTLLQPTSPLRRGFHIQRGYDLLLEKNADSISSVCEMDHSPLWSNVLPNDLSLLDFENKEVTNTPRQLLPIYYRINGALYIRKISYEDKVKVLDEKPYAYIMDQKYSIDIDTEMDFKMAEFMLKEMDEAD